jgi:hypothetical protein
VDGNKAQMDAISGRAARYRVKVPILIDFICVVQYLSKASDTFFYPGDPEARAWFGVQVAKMLRGRAHDVRAGIRRRATTYGYQATERKDVGSCAAYPVQHKFGDWRRSTRR